MSQLEPQPNLLSDILDILSILSRDMKQLQRDMTEVKASITKNTSTITILQKTTSQLESRLSNQICQLSNPHRKFFTRFAHMPFEIVVSILVWIKPQHVFKYRRVSKSFNEILISRHFAERNLERHVPIRVPLTEQEEEDQRICANENDQIYLHCPPNYQSSYSRHHLSYLTWIYWSDEHFQNSPKLPPSLGALKQLVYLHLSNCNLCGLIPESIYNLSSLSELDLGGNFLEGELSESVGEMKGLTCLQLDGNKLTGGIPESIGFLSQLKQLDFSENKFTGELPKGLGSLKNLVYLFIYKNAFEGGIPEEMYRLSQLKHFVANDNQLTVWIGIEAVRGFANLDVWDLTHNASVTSDVIQRGNHRPGWYF
ncbi:UNVERIFIED_CONTAM: hypothetical protein HDU68_006500 [Siphonaria sp. JEL0065]|nr:hypothetical protein HDU68_006500 [Siphonaria sp. JEL0065]